MITEPSKTIEYDDKRYNSQNNGTFSIQSKLTESNYTPLWANWEKQRHFLEWMGRLARNCFRSKFKSYSLVTFNVHRSSSSTGSEWPHSGSNMTSITSTPWISQIAWILRRKDKAVWHWNILIHVKASLYQQYFTSIRHQQVTVAGS